LWFRLAWEKHETGAKIIIIIIIIIITIITKAKWAGHRP
jgi:hypothetical protein